MPADTQTSTPGGTRQILARWADPAGVYRDLLGAYTETVMAATAITAAAAVTGAAVPAAVIASVRAALRGDGKNSYTQTFPG